ncbi:Phosphatidylinositol 5-phosphate 4-kinase type-2 alpha [Candida viswanathii]|uniref:Phosphatidylinositol 5-phosphate 4-kinase type-2 alpha n=1 Tax=Candida viswanathii TaxID=5486 RepID=A0A367YP67_9ASCO|nr:Phosphatidylinositol 5-phosphate 4-kinase type-2 alpha [Candida viswanathii]
MEENYITETHVLFLLERGLVMSLKHRGPPPKFEQMCEDDYNEKQIFCVKEMSNNVPINFEFVSYSPRVFDELRCLHSVNDEFYSGLTEEKIPYIEFASPGKSGAVFYRKGPYIFKTVLDVELNKLTNILKNYSEYLHKYPFSMLPHYYGAYTIRASGTKLTSFVVTNYLFYKAQLSRIYDLKGSLVGRHVLSKYPGNEREALRDCDFLREEGGIRTEDSKHRETVLNMICMDTKFLMNHNLMDYSLAVGIGPLSGVPSTDDMKCWSFVDCVGERYYIGLVDCLTDYTAAKKGETFWNAMRFKKHTSLALPPVDYRTRFITFLRGITR